MAFFKGNKKLNFGSESPTLISTSFKKMHFYNIKFMFFNFNINKR